MKAPTEFTYEDLVGGPHDVRTIIFVIAMFDPRKRSSAALSAILAAVHHHSVLSSSTLLVCHAASLGVDLKEDRQPNGRYKMGGAIPSSQQSVWGRLERGKSDEMEFFHFIGLSRDSFAELVEICRGDIDLRPLDGDCGVPQAKHLARRLYGPRGILLMSQCKIWYVDMTSITNDSLILCC